MPYSVSISPALQQVLCTETFNTLSGSFGYTVYNPNSSTDPASYDPKQTGLYGYNWGGGSGSPGINYGEIRLFQGTVPLNIAAVDQNERAADVLISWATNELTFTNTNGGTQITGSLLKNPTATGTATWFMYDILGGTTYHRLIGTVGLIDSGADFELNDTILSTATQYRIFGSLNLTLPTEFTYS